MRAFGGHRGAWRRNSVGVELIAAALSDHLGYPNSVCNHPDERAERRYETLASLIVDLTTGAFWVAGGNPCCTGFELLTWNLYDAPAREHAAVA